MEPELMYLGATSINVNIEELLKNLKATAMIDCPDCTYGPKSLYGTICISADFNMFEECPTCKGTARVAGITSEQ